jgi:iron complex outermembrane recepter protein
MSRTRLFCLALSVAFLVVVSYPGFAVPQTQTSEAPQVAITVSDSSGGVVEGAVVILFRGTTERRATTGVDGSARFTGLEPGEWTAEVRKEGFAVLQEPVMVSTRPLNVAVTLALPGISETVSVETRVGALDTTTTSASRLELSLREVPATLNVVTQETMQERGANTAIDAIEIAGGTLVSAGLGGQLPGYQTRGFSGNSIMHDGIRQNSSVQSSRPIDTFLLERVEVLKGPASLLAGEGGTAGTVNYVSKTPRQEFGMDSLMSYGSFGSRRGGVGLTGTLAKTLIGRIDASFADGGGYAKPTNQKLRAMASTLWWTPAESVTVKASGKYSDDYINSAYYTTPFIKGEVDPRMRFINYNMRDAFSKGNNNFARVDTDIALGNGWKIHNGTFAATQRLQYRNMESYTYNAVTQRVDVSGFFLIWRDDLLVGNQTEARKTVDILGRSVSFVTGFELQRNQLHRGSHDRTRTSSIRFSVDAFNPEPIYDPGLPYLRNPDVLVNNRTVYAEAQAKLARRWTSVLGVRTEEISVDYQRAVGSDDKGNKTFHPTTGRAGLVYLANDNVSFYGSYSRSIEPAAQFVSLSGCCGTATFFDLTPGRQFEGGVKGTLLRGRLEGTAAYYDIEKKNIPTRTLVDNVPTDQLIGRQKSRGIEFTATAKPYSSLLIASDFALTDATYAEFSEVVAGVPLSRKGKTPTGIPVTIWGLTPTQQFGPVSVAVSVRGIGKRWADTANTLQRPAYATLDSWISVGLPRGSRLTVRGRNLTDQMKLPGGGSASARLASPRSYEATLTMGF